MTAWRSLPFPLTMRLGRRLPTEGLSVEAVSLAAWDALLADFPEHTVFHRAAWLDALVREHNAELLLASVDDDRGCVAVWPMFRTNKGTLRITGSPMRGWNTAYLGPLFAKRCNPQAAIRAILKHPLFRPGSYSSCRMLQGRDESGMRSKAFPAWRAVDLSRFGFVEELKLQTYCLDLNRPLQDIWDGLKSECRSRIRRAEKLGVRLRVEHNDSFLDEFWEMSQWVFGICSIKPPFTRSFLQHMWDNLHAAGEVVALSAMIKDERVATLLLPFDSHSMYYWAGGSFERHRQVPSHNFLHWKAIELAKQRGLICYDFIGVEGGGGRFKRTFRPTQVQRAVQWERTSSSLVRMMRFGYEHLLRWRMQVRE